MFASLTITVTIWPFSILATLPVMLTAVFSSLPLITLSAVSLIATVTLANWSKITLSFALAVLPAKSDTVAVAVIVPLFKLDISTFSKLYWPSITVPFSSRSGLTPSDTITLIAWPFSIFSTSPVIVICEFSVLPFITPSSVCAMFNVTLL